MPRRAAPRHLPPSTPAQWRAAWADRADNAVRPNSPRDGTASNTAQDLSRLLVDSVGDAVLFRTAVRAARRWAARVLVLGSDQVSVIIVGATLASVCGAWAAAPAGRVRRRLERLQEDMVLGLIDAVVQRSSENKRTHPLEVLRTMDLIRSRVDRIATGYATAPDWTPTRLSRDWIEHTRGFCVHRLRNWAELSDRIDTVVATAVHHPAPASPAVHGVDRIVAVLDRLVLAPVGDRPRASNGRSARSVPSPAPTARRRAL